MFIVFNQFNLILIFDLLIWNIVNNVTDDITKMLPMSAWNLINSFKKNQTQKGPKENSKSIKNLPLKHEDVLLKK